MIDIENAVYTAVRTAVKAAYPSASLSSEPSLVAPSFPHVSIVEMDNYTDARHMSNTNRETAVAVAYEVNVYTNTDTKQADAKAIAAVVDAAFSNMGFRRSFKDSVPNMDRTIYRIVLRYHGVVAKAYSGTADKYMVVAR